MKGSLHLPLRGIPQQIIYAHHSLYLRSQHDEGQSLGVYRFPLYQSIKGKLETETLPTSAGLIQLNEQATVEWIGYHSQSDQVWFIDEMKQLVIIKPSRISMQETQERRSSGRSRP